MFFTISKGCKINTINGGPNGTVEITYCTKTIIIHISSMYRESIILDVMISLENLLTLGLPWIQLHNPQISWLDKEITKWSHFSLIQCLLCPCSTLATT